MLFCCMLLLLTTMGISKQNQKYYWLVPTQELEENKKIKNNWCQFQFSQLLDYSGYGKVKFSFSETP
uniref:Very-long-chain enoyl-CoA reductase-like n=1 Tax=Rhizophora mucronata TaxID=61149 RepID=A0A2P2JKY0_RHIMU